MIITHKGQAHRDDFLAVCTLLAVDGIQEVVRRDPTPEEINDPNIWVVDVGGEHSPKKKNFDHHQDRNSVCAFILLLNHLGLREAAANVFPWLVFTNSLDTKGPFATAKEMGIASDTLMQILSPIEEQLLRFFESQEKVSVETRLLMANIGNGIINKIHFYQKRMVELTENSVILPIGDVAVISHAISNRPSSFMDEFRKLHCPEVAVSIVPDDRGDGWTLYRFDDHPRVDFSILEGDESIVFAHKGGFVAKTKNIPIFQAIALVERAILPPA